MASALPVSSDSALDGGTRTVAHTGLANYWVICAGALVLLLPNVLLALQLRPLPASLMLLGAVGSIALLRSGPARITDGLLSQPIDLTRFATCLTLSAALLLIAGEGHLAFANWDWFWRDAVLADLAKAPFPPSYEVRGQTFFLRAPLGMYMVPAMVAKAAGLAAGHATLLLQNALILTLALYLLSTLAGRHAVLVVVVFLAFSGLDAIGEVVMWLAQGRSLSTFVLPSHIEQWTIFQYSSVVTQLFWVPNHALPAYWLTVLVVLCARREVTVVELGLGLAASLFWSPFAFIGALPFALYLFARRARETVTTPRFWLASGVVLCFLPVAFYMQADAAKVPHEFIFFYPLVAFAIVLFLAVEIPHVLICRATWAAYDAGMRALLAIAVAVLLVLPTMRVGLANDLVMRASIPSLMILAIAFAQALATARSERRWGLLGVGALLALVAAITPFQELRRALAFPRFSISDCDLVTVWKKLAPAQTSLDNYLARGALKPSWLIGAGDARPLRAVSERVCWPDYPFNPRGHITTLSNTMLAQEPKGPPL